MSVYPHIQIGNDGVAMIGDTTTKVVEVVQDHLAHHWSAENIHRQHRHLSLAQIHAALAFYYDHQQEMDADIERRWQRSMELKQKHDDPTIRRLGICHERAARPGP